VENRKHLIRRLRQLLSKTAAGNLFEIESSKLALSKTRTSQVRTFANEMVKDHTDAS
jgi:putative membrane protein